VDKEVVARALFRIERGLGRAVESGELADADAEAARARLSTSTDLEAAARGADHLIETVIEDLGAKIDVLRRADVSCHDKVIFATNTSQLSISRLAAATSRPDRVIGSHWFNPPPVMRLIEIIRGRETSDETLHTALDLAARYGKETVVCNKDVPGFITSRLIALLIVEAARIVEEGVASVEDVNKACVLAFNHAQGVLDTADLSGLDTVERVADNLTEYFGDRFRVPPNIRALVNAGHFGRKTGRGFREYRRAP
jgi:3-hydroxybutyryl-CoA dehydrogenase